MFYIVLERAMRHIEVIGPFASTEAALIWAREKVKYVTYRTVQLTAPENFDEGE
jgi:hypothetical protein